MNTSPVVPTTTPEDMAKSRAWVGRLFAGATDLPISFVLDGKAIHGIPDDWHPVAHRRLIDANICETVFEGTDPRTGLNVRVESTEYRDYPVIEWVAWFANQGQDTTPLIRDILAMDSMFEGQSPVLYHCNGDFYSEEGYTPELTPLHAGQTAAFSPDGGRPSDGAFPYYRIMFDGCGLTVAIGWPGKWAARFARLAEGIRVRVGQEKTNLRLKRGETIRTPRMTVLSWAGDTTRAVNLWRRWYRAHILPRPNGQPMQPLLACAGTDDGEEFTAASEENQIRYIDKFRQHGIRPDIWWIDAGWYPCYNKDHERRWGVTGTWEPDPERFPHGLKPVSDCAAQGGADLLVWFEPERIHLSSKLAREHPQWLRWGADSWDSAMLNLGDPPCRQWLTDHVCSLIRDNGIKVYRQDCNFTPLEQWRKNEAEDRQGMNENLHVQSYLQYWDDLLARNPGLWIDSCASGGRRNDLETMRRAVPLHYSDYGYGDHPVKLGFHHTLYEWLPYFKECTLSWDSGGKGRFDNQIDSFSFHCGMAPMLFATLDIRRDDYDYALAGKMIDIWHQASGLILNGDYYPHTPFRRSDREWVAWQFDCPETGRGLIQGIRLPASAQETITIHPHGIRTDATYCFENPESSETRELSGEDLLHAGFTLALPARSAAIWFYRRMVKDAVAA